MYYMQIVVFLFELEMRICHCCTSPPSLSRIVHIGCPCRTILRSLRTDKSCNAIYPHMLQVAVPPAFNRYQNMVCQQTKSTRLCDKHKRYCHLSLHAAVAVPFAFIDISTCFVRGTRNTLVCQIKGAILCNKDRCISSVR